MTDSPTVTDAKTQGVSAVISFSDGHTAIFEGFSEGYGSTINYLRHFILRRSEQAVVRFDSKTQRGGPYPDDHQFVEVADGYSIERIAAYWEAAWEYVLEHFIQKPNRDNSGIPWHLGYPYHVIDVSLDDLRAIQAGSMPLPQ